MGVFSHVFQVESANSLFTDLFIQALRRFVSRMGNDKSSELVLVQILLGPVQNHIFRDKLHKINVFMLEHGGQ